ncbi:hypothetical protein DL98DRAFT_357436, partial [Cadophora sp. DSE1049]
LADKPDYEALSYAWGEPVLNHEIEFPEGNLPITQHLYSALQKLRPQHQSRRLWVDAICINQNDKTEKGHQVALMADIYRGASGVVAWLG